MNGCTHEVGEYQTLTHWSGYDEPPITTREYVMVSAFTDVDTHRYRCVVCGEVRYYSDRAAAAYKTGVPDLDIGITKEKLSGEKK